MADERPVPDWLLERLVRGELPDAEASRVRARLEARGETARLDALELSDREILATHPPALVAAEVHRRAQAAERARRTMRWTTPVFSAVALGAAGLAVVFAMGRSPSQVSSGLGGALSDDPEVTTSKGLAPHLALYRKQDKRADRLSDGATVRPGDLLQVAYVAAGRRYGMIASIDARDAVTLHLPERAGAAVRLQAGKEVALPHAFELDASPGFERFVFVTSDAPFDTASALSALRRDGPPPPPALTVVAFTVYKDTR